MYEFLTLANNLAPRVEDASLVSDTHADELTTPKQRLEEFCQLERRGMMEMKNPSLLYEGDPVALAVALIGAIRFTGNAIYSTMLQVANGEDVPVKNVLKTFLLKKMEIHSSLQELVTNSPKTLCWAIALLYDLSSKGKIQKSLD